MPILPDPGEGGGGGGDPGPFTIAVTSTGPGVVSPASQSVDQGDSAVITITPSANAAVKNIMLDGVPVAPDDSLTITGVVSDHEVEVVFVATSGLNVYDHIPEGGTLADSNMVGAEPPKFRMKQYADEPEAPAPTHHMGRRRYGRPWESPKS